MKHGENKVSSSDKLKKKAGEQKVEKKKYISPSTRNRNANRLKAFKAKKAGKVLDNKVTNDKASDLNNSETTAKKDTLSDNINITSEDPTVSDKNDEETIHTRDDPTNLETRRVDVPLVVAVDVHPPPILPPKKKTRNPKNPTSTPVPPM